eukprot:Protomagalhaensia_sp_Gyna_25__5387@NODE_695_length_2823_cov_1374_900503_g543_i0_p1_GENE_NODE_695_length_2823_cov_1374_900503_g543_i0NODE_695_length_2823_cov_1374_900503_g543_i0_p1_ORF_typecomplete_len301_score48_57HTH_35/PF13693_6/0_12_NODE_695_length_2823_cov_1374_900503_g543_i071973
MKWSGILGLVVGILASEEEYLGHNLGVVVAIQPGLAEPTFSAEGLSTPDPPDYSTWPAISNNNELEKRAVQSVLHRPEPLLAKAIALSSESTRANLRRLQVLASLCIVLRASYSKSRRLYVSFHVGPFISMSVPLPVTFGPCTFFQISHRRAQRRALKDSISIGSSELSVQDQQALIEGLLASGALLPTDVSSSVSASISSVSSSTSSVSPSASVSSSGAVSPSGSAVEASGVTDSVGTGIPPSGSPLSYLNEVLSGLNSAMGAVTTTTPSPEVAIVRGVDTFIQGINQLLALQLAAQQL